MTDFNTALQSLSMLIETEIGESAVVLVTSASSRDGSGFVARGLAGAYAERGVKVAYATLDDSAGVGGSTDEGSYDTIAIGGLPARTSTRQFASLIEDWRRRYDVVIVDGPSLLGSPKALHFARVANGLLLTVRSGRSVRREDRELANLAERLGTKILGVVQTPANMPRESKAAERVGRRGFVAQFSSLFSRA